MATELDKLITDRKEPEAKRLKEQAGTVDPGFNVFALVSDTYHRENFHSDVIAAILDPGSKHGAGNMYLINFINLINSIRSVVNAEHYQHSITVERESGRRDITITGSDKHAIIIENKMYDAVDTYNQIPKYVDQLEKEGFTVDAVIYLTLNQAKEPDKSTWDADKTEKIESKLVSIRAYDGTERDFCNGWLRKCIETTSHIDSLSILRQYNNIIRHLTSNHMDHEYYKNLQHYFVENPGSAQTAIALKDALDEYPKYTLVKIFQHFNGESRFRPFRAIRYYSSHLYFLDSYEAAGFRFNTDIIIRDLNSCIIDFSVRDDVEYQRAHPEIVLKCIGMLDKFEWQPRGRYEHYITGDFTSFEQRAIEFIEDFIQKLKKNEALIKESLQLLASPHQVLN